MTTPAQLKVSRSRELDVLRCLAILLVLCHHAPPAPAEAPALLRWLAGLVAASAVAGRRLGRVLFLLDLPLALDGAERGDWPASGKKHVPWRLAVLAYLAAAIGTGALLGRLVEVLFLKIRDRFFPSRSQPDPSLTQTNPTAAGE